MKPVKTEPAETVTTIKRERSGRNYNKYILFEANNIELASIIHKVIGKIIPTLLNLTILFCPIKPQIKNVNCLNDFSSFPEYNFELNLCQIPLTGPRHP